MFYIVTLNRSDKVCRGRLPKLDIRTQIEITEKIIKGGKRAELIKEYDISMDTLYRYYVKHKWYVLTYLGLTERDIVRSKPNEYKRVSEYLQLLITERIIKGETRSDISKEYGLTLAKVIEIFSRRKNYVALMLGVDPTSLVKNQQKEIFTEEEKLNIVVRSYRGESRQKLSKELSVSSKTITKYINKYKDKAIQILISEGHFSEQNYEMEIFYRNNPTALDLKGQMEVAKLVINGSSLREVSNKYDISTATVNRYYYKHKDNL